MDVLRSCCGAPEGSRYKAKAESQGLEDRPVVANPWHVNVGVFGPNNSGKNTFLKQVMYTTNAMTPRLAGALVFHARKHWVSEVVNRLRALEDFGEKKKVKKFAKEVKAMNELKRRLESHTKEPYDKATKMISTYHSRLFKLLDGIRGDIFEREDEYLQCRSAFSLDPRPPPLQLTFKFKHNIHPTNFSPVDYKTENFQFKFFHSYYNSLTEQMEVEDLGRELDMMILLFSAADVIEEGKFEESVRNHKWILDIALNEYGPTTIIVLSNIDVLDDFCTKNNLSISKELEKATDFLAEAFNDISENLPKTPHIEAMDLTKGKFFYRILKTINSAMVEEVEGMPLKQYKEQRKKNYLKSVYSIGGRRGSQVTMSSELVRASFEGDFN
ncbi:hypothetical protein A3770_09p55230 [Chloropicon primus]|uniref:Uncharacterized protein n=1 Tax=Chloropicon primus TaxID=1764295 RepID=A0A5B8MTM7_9CHLO|nr:hypothetical protein A3770_09p55230 [Chloropicon primus]|eukprot:QDZ23005.1 hypothetical protein A3770_09p55230 [Chloropicon primus]